MNTLQVYNWFSKRYIQVILIIFFMMQFFGYLTPSNVLSFHETECDYLAEPMFFFVCGAGMLILGTIDIWTFCFHPLQKNIFLDQDSH